MNDIEIILKERKLEKEKLKIKNLKANKKACEDSLKIIIGEKNIEKQLEEILKEIELTNNKIIKYSKQIEEAKKADTFGEEMSMN